MDYCPFTGTPCSSPKVYHITDILGKEVKQMHFCQNCFLNQYKSKMHEVISFINCLISEKEKLLSKKCKCGWGLEDMAKIERIGCPECYETFKEELMPMIHKCQNGETHHIGKKPSNYEQLIEAKQQKLNVEEQIQTLRLKMAKAIEIENYEVAGVLKKKIEELQTKVNN